ncbi:putative DIS3-like exonuclease 2, partial [Hypsibius exemplaris]
MEPDGASVRHCSAGSPRTLMDPVPMPREDAVQCSYCGQEGDSFLIQCREVNCWLYFCNGCNIQESSPGKLDSHIISHQRISRHHRIAVYHRQDHNGPEAAPTFEHDQKYYTFGCRPVTCDHVHSPTENDHYDRSSEENGWFCELRQIEWKRYRSGTKLLPMVERSHPTYKHLSLRLALVPTESDQKGYNLISRKDINAQERAWFFNNCGLAALLNRPAVLSAPVYSFMNEREYNEYPPGASDLDDAVSYKVLTDGTLEIGVHIADVTSFVEAGSNIDRYLRGRGSSVYMIDKVVHMMPEALMNECSLIKHEERRVVSVVHTFSPSGEDLGYRITRGRIRSCAQLTYMDAEDIIKKGCLSVCLSDFGDKAKEICEAIVSVNRIAQILRAKRLAGGTRAINLKKIRYERGDDGRSVMVQVQKESLKSNQLIEELALLTNSVAAWEIQKAFPNLALLRRQQPPRADVLSKLVRLCDQEKLQLSSYAQQSLPALLEEVLVSRPDLHPVLQAQCIKKTRIAEYVCTGNEKDTHHFSLNILYYTHM